MVEIVKDTLKKLEEDERSKLWFMEHYMPKNFVYSTINNQLLGYTKKPSPDLVKACNDYLGGSTNGKR